MSLHYLLHILAIVFPSLPPPQPQLAPLPILPNSSLPTPRPAGSAAPQDPSRRSPARFRKTLSPSPTSIQCRKWPIGVRIRRSEISRRASRETASCPPHWNYFLTLCTGRCVRSIGEPETPGCQCSACCRRHSDPKSDRLVQRSHHHGSLRRFSVPSVPHFF